MKKIKRFLKRAAAFGLAVALITNSFPAAAFAEGMGESEPAIVMNAQDSVSYIDANGQGAIATNVTEISASNMPTELNGWYVVSGIVDYGNTITLAGDTHIILANDAMMNIGSDDNRINGKGIFSLEYSLNVYSQSSGSSEGALNVYTGGYNSDAIFVKSITINGGVITTSASGSDGSGIRTYHGKVTIHGGSITSTATGNDESFGIKSSGSVIYNGGQVTATGSNKGVCCIDGNVSLSWRNATDFFETNSIFSIEDISIATGKIFKTESETYYYSDNAAEVATLINENTAGNTRLSAADAYLVTFNSNGGSEVAPQIVEANGTVAKPADPTNGNETFGGWYQDASLQNPYNFNAAVTGTVTLYAKWVTISHSMTDASIQKIYRLTGSTIAPTVWNNMGTLLAAGTDYDYTVSGTGTELMNAGTYTLTVTGTGSYSGTQTVTVRVLTFDEYDAASDSLITTTLPEGVTANVVDSATTVMTSGWYVVTEDATITERIKVNGAVHLVLCDGATLTAEKGISVTDGNALTIYAQSDNTGALVASGATDSYSAAIGGDGESSNGTPVKAGTITIHGGVITADPYSEGMIIPKELAGTAVDVTQALAIGAANSGTAGSITIYGGQITANVTKTGTVGIGGAGATIHLGWCRENSDYIWSLGYYGTVIFDKGFRLDGEDTFATAENCAGKKLVPTTLTSADVFTVSFESNGGSEVAAQEIIKGFRAQKPVTPIRAGYRFMGWYAAQDLSGAAYDFSTPVTDNVTLHAKWDALPAISYRGEEGQIFTDFTNYSLMEGDYTTLPAGTYFVVANTELSNRITVRGTVNLILGDGYTLTAPKGIFVGKDQTLNIFCQSAGTGALTAGAEDGNAAIGGNAKVEASSANKLGTVRIYGGTVTATGGAGAAGIGGGDMSENGKVEIYGGTVTATGGAYKSGSGAGIGSGRGGTAMKVMIRGGAVIATGGAAVGEAEGGAAIGSGAAGRENTVEIYGGTVTATGGNMAAAIGSGSTSNYNTVKIYGGTVTAIGGAGAAGIGSGNGGQDNAVEIHGGTVDATGGTAVLRGFVYVGGAAIGGGGYGRGNMVKIYDGTVTANGGQKAAAIGGVYNDNNTTVQILGGKVTAIADTNGTGVGDGNRGGDYLNYAPAAITLGYEAADDFIQSSGYSGTVTVADDRMFQTDDAAPVNVSGNVNNNATIDGKKLMPRKCTVSFDLNVGSGTTPDAQTDLLYGIDKATLPATANPTRAGYLFKEWQLNGATYNFDDPVTDDLTLAAAWTPDPAHFSVNAAGDEYTIHTAIGWGVFCDLLEENTKGYFDGKTVKLGADITVSRPAGSDYHDFTGEFDGQNNTITLSIGTAQKPYTGYASLFCNTGDNGNYKASIHDLTVDGTIYASEVYAAGFVAKAYGAIDITRCISKVTIRTSNKDAAGFVGYSYANLNIEDCVSDVTIISSVTNDSENDGTHGGFVGVQQNNSNYDVSITGCAFTGKLLTTNGGTRCGGFVGWRIQDVTITDCIYAPSDLEDGENEVQAGTGDNISATFARNAASGSIGNCFYTRTLGTEQGKAAHIVTADDNVSIDNIAPTGTSTTYTVSGITAYGGGGLSYGGKLYYGDGDELSLALSHGEVPEGDTFECYNVSEGSLTGNDADGYVLTMPDADVTVSLGSMQIIASQPSDLNLTYGYETGNVLTIAVNSLEGHSQSYQWYVSESARYEGAAAIDGATEDSYIVPTGKSVGTLYYYCVVTDVRDESGEMATASSGLVTVTIEKADYTQTVQIEDVTQYVPRDKAGEFTVTLPELPEGANYYFTLTDEGGMIDTLPAECAENTLTFTTKGEIASGTTATITVEARDALNYNDYSFDVIVTVSGYTVEYAWPEQTNIYLIGNDWAFCDRDEVERPYHDNELVWEEAGITLDTEKITVSGGTPTNVVYKVNNTVLNAGENTLVLAPGVHRISITGDGLDDWVEFKVIKLIENDPNFEFTVSQTPARFAAPEEAEELGLRTSPDGLIAECRPDMQAKYNGTDVSDSATLWYRSGGFNYDDQELYNNDAYRTPGYGITGYSTTFWVRNGLNGYLTLHNIINGSATLDGVSRIDTICGQLVWHHEGETFKQKLDLDGNAVSSGVEGGYVYYVGVDCPDFYLKNGKVHYKDKTGEHLETENMTYTDGQDIFYAGGETILQYDGFIGYGDLAFEVDDTKPVPLCENIKAIGNRMGKECHCPKDTDGNCTECLSQNGDTITVCGDTFEMGSYFVVGENFIFTGGRAIYNIVPSDSNYFVARDFSTTIDGSIIKFFDYEIDAGSRPILKIDISLIPGPHSTNKSHLYLPCAFARYETAPYCYVIARSNFPVDVRRSVVNIEGPFEFKAGEDVDIQITTSSYKYPEDKGTYKGSTGDLRFYLDNVYLRSMSDPSRSYECGLGTLPEGTYKFRVVLNGDEGYRSATATVTIRVVRDDSEVTLTGTSHSGKEIEDGGTLVYDPEGTFVIEAAAARIPTEEELQSGVDMLDLSINVADWKWQISNTSDEDVVEIDQPESETTNLNHEQLYLKTVGLGTVTLKAGFRGDDKYKSAIGALTFTVIPMDVEEPMIELADQGVILYDGTEKEPAVNVYYAEGKLIPTDQYDVTYENNINATTAEGKAKVIVRSKEGSLYNVDAELEFEILGGVTIADGIEHGTVAVSDGRTDFMQGETVTLTVTMDEGYGVDTLCYDDGNMVQTITADANGVYGFEMPAASVTVRAVFLRDVGIDMTVDVENVVLYTGDLVTPSVSVVDRMGDVAELVQGTDYAVSYAENIGSPAEVTEGIVIITGIGNYTGTAKATFNITPFNIADCKIGGKLEAYVDEYGGVLGPLESSAEVWYGESKLQCGTDYILSIEEADEYEVGETYLATVTGVRDWAGTQTFTFTVIELHHTVVFDPGEGSGEMDDDTIGNDGNGYPGRYELPDCDHFTAPVGYEFDHWEVSCEPGVVKHSGDYFTVPYIFSPSDVDTFTVTATWRKKQYTITAAGLEHGSLLVNGEVAELTQGTFTACMDDLITIMPKEGYVLKTLTVMQGETALETTQGSGDKANEFTFTMPAGNVTVTATFVSMDEAARAICFATAFQGKFQMNFYFYLPESVTSDEGAYAMFTGGSADKKIMIGSLTGTETEDGVKYKLSYNVYAKEVRDKINLKLYYGNGDPVEVVSATGMMSYTETGIETTLLAYLDYCLDSSDEKTVALAKAAKDYCTAAQIYFGYKAEGLSFADELEAVTEETLSPYEAKITGTMPKGVSIDSISLVVAADNSFRLYFKYDGTVSPKKYKYYVNGTAVKLKSSGGKYYLEVKNIGSNHLDDDITFTISRGTKSCDVTVSALTYARSSLLYGNGNVIKLAQALYLYNQAAVAKFGK